MRRIREVLRLYFDFQLSVRSIARGTHVSRTAVREVLDRVQKTGLTRDVLLPMGDGEIEAALYGQTPATKETRGRALPDWNWVHRELRGKGVTLRLLWEEFREEHPDGIGYSQFCARYQAIRKSLELTMRQVHKPGEALLVDYSGDKLQIVDRTTGEIRPVEVYCATLPASDYVYVDVTFTQSTEDFVASTERAFKAIGGVTRTIVLDNLKAGVTKPDPYDPVINETFADFCRHYGVVILPARVRKPRDKASVEGHVLIVQRRVLAPLRNRTFYSLTDLRQAVATHVYQVNQKPFQKLEGSRASIFEEVEKPCLGPLPDSPYEYATFSKHKVNLDYHVEVEHGFYSVPYQYAHKEVQARTTARTVEILCAGKRIASHVRTQHKGGYVTNPEHMPEGHRGYAERTPQKLLGQAREIGENTLHLCEAILSARPHPEQGYRSVLGVLRLSRRYPTARMERASAMCLALHVLSSGGLRHVLENSTEALYDPQAPPSEISLGAHDNVRGAAYFDGIEEESHA